MILSNKMIFENIIDFDELNKFDLPGKALEHSCFVKREKYFYLNVHLYVFFFKRLVGTSER